MMKLRALAFAFTVALFACTTTEYVVQGGTPTDPLGSPDGGGAIVGGDAGTSDAVAPKTPKQTCEALIACVADVSPSQAGPLVTLYGDASNCWKGGPADADACGKACAKELEERDECTTAPLDGNYAALCTGAGNMLRYHVQLVFDARKGGNAVFRPLPPQVTTFKASAALMTQPAVPLHIESDGGAGRSPAPFDMPGAALNPGMPNVHVASFEITRLRKEGLGACSSLKAQLGAPIQSLLDGKCMYFPIKDGDPMPTATSSDISDCTLKDSAPP